MQIRLLVFYDFVILFFFWEQRRVYCLGQEGRIVNSYSEELRSLVVFREEGLGGFLFVCFGFNYLFLAALGLCCFAWTFSSCTE